MSTWEPDHPRTARSLRPDRVTFDRGNERWSPGVLWAINGATATVRIFCTPGVLRDFSIPMSALPNPNSSIGCPLACRMADEGAMSFTLAEVGGTHWAGRTGPGAQEAAAVARGEFFFAAINRDITNEPLYWD
jgi:hypothetical protein